MDAHNDISSFHFLPDFDKLIKTNGRVDRLIRPAAPGPQREAGPAHGIRIDPADYSSMRDSNFTDDRSRVHAAKVFKGRRITTLSRDHMLKLFPGGAVIEPGAEFHGINEADFGR